MKRPCFLPLLGVLALVSLSACEHQQNTLTEPEVSPAYGKVKDVRPNQSADLIDAQIRDLMVVVNQQLATDGVNYRVAVGEWLGFGLAGHTVYFSNRGPLQLGHDFVPFDERRLWSGPVDGQDDNITWAVDQTDDAVPPGDLTAADATAAITDAMATWNGQRCTYLPLNQNPDFDIDVGVVAWENGLGGSPLVFADVQHAGWEINFGPDILGVTFTYIFVDGETPTDINHDRKIDTAFREIYYNPFYLWAVDGVPSRVDVETVAAHEMGHGLSQAHFGKLFMTDANGKIHFAPRALMNAGYTGIQQTLLPTDLAGHCSLWARWPNN